MHSESRYSIYVSHAGALFFYQRKDPGRPRFGGRADLYAISKRKLLALSAIEARTSDLYWVPLSHSDVPEVYTQLRRRPPEDELETCRGF